MSSLNWINDELAALDAQNLRRELRVFEGARGVVLRHGGREFVNFGSNDYLNLAGDPRLAKAVVESVEREGWGSGASPLVTGRASPHAELESRLAQFEHAEAALLFSSGFAANVGTIAALVGPGDAIFSDERNHASIIDGCRLSRAEVHVYQHCDAEHLGRLLENRRGLSPFAVPGEQKGSDPFSADGSRVGPKRLIVTDSVFSMDGDLAPLGEIVELAERFDAMLLIDEAHATGVFGEQGGGVCEALGIADRVAVRVGTLSKAVGCAGGFVLGTRPLIDWLTNRARPYVFSTAHPAATAAAALAALDIIREEPWRRLRLLATASLLRDLLRSRGWNVGTSTSQIIPIILGDATQTMEMSAALFERGFLVPGIRPPSVPEGQSLLRISLSCGHTPEMIDAVVANLASIEASSTRPTPINSPVRFPPPCGEG